jgi:hypothetical protein
MRHDPFPAANRVLIETAGFRRLHFCRKVLVANYRILTPCFLSLGPPEKWLGGVFSRGVKTRQFQTRRTDGAETSACVATSLCWHERPRKNKNPENIVVCGIFYW